MQPENQEPPKSKPPLLLYYAIGATIILLLIIIFGMGKFTLDPIYIYAGAGLLAVGIVAKYYFQSQRYLSIWEIAQKIREQEYKRTGVVYILTPDNIDSHRSILRHCVYLRFLKSHPIDSDGNTVSRTYEYDLLTGKVVSMSNYTIQDILRQEQNTEVVEKLKSGELLVNRLKDLDMRGE